MKRARWALIALLLGLLAPACSRISLGWRAAPWILKLEGADWLGLQGAEKDAFGKDARAWLQQTASRQGAPLAALFRQAAEALQGRQDDEVLGLLFERGPELWDRVLESAVPPLAATLAQDPSRRAGALQKTFDQRNERDFQRWSSPEKARADQERRLRAGLKDWIGELSEAQENGLQRWSQEAGFPVEAWKADRLRRQQGLLQALRHSEPQEALQARLHAWWIEPEKDRDPAYQRALAAYRQRLRLACGRLLASLSAGQRERLQQRVNALAEDLEGIARQSAEKAGK